MGIENNLRFIRTDEGTVDQNEYAWEFIRKLRSDSDIQKGFVEKVNITPDQQKEYMGKYAHKYYVAVDPTGVIYGYVGSVDGDIRVAVVKEHQGKGVGKFMVNNLMEIKENSYAKMFHDNVASINLFKSCGFVEFDSDDKFKYYKKPVD